MWLLLALLGLPLIELAGLLWAAAWFGPWPTFGAVVLAGVAGVWIIRRAGRDQARAFAAGLGRRRHPLADLADGSLVVLAGGLLLVPGFLTDAAGLLLLLPAVRQALLRRVSRSVTVAAVGSPGWSASAARGGGAGDAHADVHGDVIEGEFRELERRAAGRGEPPRPPAARH